MTAARRARPGQYPARTAGPSEPGVHRPGDRRPAARPAPGGAGSAPSVHGQAADGELAADPLQQLRRRRRGLREGEAPVPGPRTCARRAGGTAAPPPAARSAARRRSRRPRPRWPRRRSARAPARTGSRSGCRGRRGGGRSAASGRPPRSGSPGGTSPGPSDLMSSSTRSVASSRASSARAPRKPEVSSAVCSPRSWQRRSTSPVNAGCSSGSPPLIVTPPPATVMNRRYFPISASSSSTVRCWPLRRYQVSGLWQYRQRSGQPARNATNRVPGPSTPVDRSQEWTAPVSSAVARVFTATRGRSGRPRRAAAPG